MPRLPIDYSKGFIYKLCCKDKNIDDCYIGSSTNWIKRKNTHKTDCNNPKSKSYNEKKYVFIRENGDWDNWEMILIHNYSCNTSQELRKEEERVRQEYHNNLNSYKAYISQEEILEKEKQRYIDNRDKILEREKQRYIDNRDKILEKNKKYREDNKDKIAKQKKQYHIDNKDKILEQKKQYRIDNKDKLKQKITCDCGCEVIKHQLKRHKKSNKHKKLIEQNI